jgi:transposase
MAYNFLACDRDQAFLLPPDLRDWLPADHLAWFLLDVVDQLDLDPFLSAYRADGHGRAAYDPRMLLSVLLYAYCTGIRSSRQIERRCHEDIAFRVLAANTHPDHVTIARFRARHEQALAGLLVQSLRLCAAAGLVRVGTVALDGTKLAANAAAKRNRTSEQLHTGIQAEVQRMLEQARQTDQHEDQEHTATGAASGAVLPADLASRGGRLARLREAKARLDAEAAQREQTYQTRVAVSIAKAKAAGRPPRASYRHRPRDEAPRPDATANTTDPDSRRIAGRHGSVQGYNAQAIATSEQIIVAAGLAQTSNDLQQLAPMLTSVRATLAAAGISDRPEVLLADSGYWSIANLTTIPAEIPDAPKLLIAPAKHAREGKPRKDGAPSASRSTGLRQAMAAKLASLDGKARYKLRKQTIEPVFGQIKEIRGARRFQRRGLRACTAEWHLLCGTHNLLKLWRQGITT